MFVLGLQIRSEGGASIVQWRHTPSSIPHPVRFQKREVWLGRPRKATAVGVGCVWILYRKPCKSLGKLSLSQDFAGGWVLVTLLEYYPKSIIHEDWASFHPSVYHITKFITNLSQPKLVLLWKLKCLTWSPRSSYSVHCYSTFTGINLSVNVWRDRFTFGLKGELPALIRHSGGGINCGDLVAKHMVTDLPTLHKIHHKIYPMVAVLLPTLLFNPHNY